MNLLELADKIGVKGFLHCEELAKLVELAANKHVLEIGSFRGLSAWGMAISAKTVTCVDTFRADSGGQKQTNNFTTLDDFQRATSRFNNVWIHMGSSLEVDLPDDGDEIFDMIFLDAMHDYDSVLADIKHWWPKVRKGGMLVLHDYHHDAAHAWPGVAKAADEIFGHAPEGTTLVTLRWIQKPLSA